MSQTKKSGLPPNIPFGINEETIELMRSRSKKAILKSAEEIKLKGDFFMPMIIITTAEDHEHIKQIVIPELARLQLEDDVCGLPHCMLDKILDVISGMDLQPLYFLYFQEATVKTKSIDGNGNIQQEGETEDILLEQTIYAFDKKTTTCIYGFNRIKKHYEEKEIKYKVLIEADWEDVFQFYYKERNYPRPEYGQMSRMVKVMDDVMATMSHCGEKMPNGYVIGETKNGDRVSLPIKNISYFFDKEDFVKELFPNYIKRKIKKIYDGGVSPSGVVLMLPPIFTDRNEYLYVYQVGGMPFPAVRYISKKEGGHYEIQGLPYGEKPEGIPEMFLDLFPKR